MQSVGTPDAVFLEENLVDDVWGQAPLSQHAACEGTGPAQRLFDREDVDHG